MTLRRTLLGTTATAAAALALPAIRRAHAEVTEVLIAKQFGTLYLQQNVMEAQRLVEKHGALLGLPGLKASYVRLGGTGAVTDALLSGSLHFASGGAPGALLLWDRTHGGVRSAFAMNATNNRLLTVNPKVFGIKDITTQDRIALPAAKISPQAIYLQMAAVKEWGPQAWDRLDAMTISRAHPEAMAEMLGRTEVTCHFSSSPFQDRELAMPGVREIASSYAIQGVDLSTPTTIYATATFRASNPLAWRATLAAFQEATDWINEAPREAAEIYLRLSGDHDTLEGVLAAMLAPGNKYTLQPSGIMRLANFMADTGVLKLRPESLAALFFPEAAERGGT
jgi:NitT/TauT family transport system substrate-binding protein